MHRYPTWLAFLLLTGCPPAEVPQSQDPPPEPAARLTPSDNCIEHDTSKKSKTLVAYPNREFTPGFVAILANPDQFHGKRVRVKGFLHVEFEGTAIYLCKDHADHLVTENGLWVDFDPSVIPADDRPFGPSKMNRKWVMLEGTFDKDRTGHMSSWSGSLVKVDRVMELTNYSSD